MFDAWGRAIHRYRRWVAGLSLLVVAVAGGWGAGVFGALRSGGFEAPGSESQRAEQVATRELGRDDTDVVVIYRSAEETVDSPRYRAAVTDTLGALPTDRVTGVSTYWSTSSPAFVNDDRHATYAVLQLAGGDDDERAANYDAISDRLDAPGLTRQTAGAVPTSEAISDQVSSDIGTAEGVSTPVLLVLLLVIFGGLVAASLPLVVGGVAIVGSFAALRLLTLGTDVSVFAINIVTMLGLGLAIDYGLFMVSRFREELRRNDSVEDALARTMATAGRTIAVSGVTVAVALAGLLLFPQLFLRSMGFGGIAAVVVDMLAALTVLPALLAMLGRRVDALSVRRWLRRRPAAAGGPAPDADSRAGAPESAGESPAAVGGSRSGGWYRIASSVMRRPLAYALVITAGLLVLGTPFLRISWGGVDERVLPASSQARQATEALAREFPDSLTYPINVIVQLPESIGTGGGAGQPGQPGEFSQPTQPGQPLPLTGELAGYVDRLNQVAGVTDAVATDTNGHTVRIAVRYDGAPLSEQARDTVTRVRAVEPPPGATALVGGASATVVDTLDSLGSRLPWMALVVGVATFVLLFLAFGSVVLPFKAMLMNVLSLSATFGALVWVFQDGHLSGLLGFTPTGTIEPSMPILLLAIVFGLSMDYEVFLLSRVREEYDRTGDNTAAVARGLQRTGGIITSAALLLLVVFGAFMISGITFIKLTGVGMIVAVVVEATVVRVLLVPATMRLLGRVNWWAPRPLRRLYARYGISESDSLPATEPARQPASV